MADEISDRLNAAIVRACVRCARRVQADIPILDEATAQLASWFDEIVRAELLPAIGASSSQEAARLRDGIAPLLAKLSGILNEARITLQYPLDHKGAIYEKAQRDSIKDVEVGMALIRAALKEGAPNER